MAKFQKISFAFFVVGLVGFAWVFFDLIYPNPPLRDRQHPEYAERLVMAAQLNAANPGFSDRQVARTQATILPILAKLKELHPEGTPSQFAEAEAKMTASVTSFYQTSKERVLHFWATYYSADDMKLLLYRDKIPYLPTAHHRARLWWTFRRHKPEFERMMADMRAKSKSRHKAMVQDVYTIFQASD